MQLLKSLQKSYEVLKETRSVDAKVFIIINN